VLVLEPTPAYTPSMEVAWLATTGEWYRVLTQEEGWVLAYWEGDSPELVVWIEVTEAVAVQLFPVVAPQAVPAATPRPTPPIAGQTTSSAVQVNGPIAPYMANSPEYGMDVFV